MKIYSSKTVLESAIDRISYLFDEFENIVIGFSGGKDSTVTLNLALSVAEKKNRLPLTVMFIDQEAEWQGTIDYVTKVMSDSRIKPMWFQMPMVITNNASSYDRYSYCWKKEDEYKWIHPQNNISIKENVYGTNRFHELFAKIFKYHFKDKKSCYLAGVRTEENPKRFVALTSSQTYKFITWGKVLDKKLNHFTFYPIYDWSYTDIWKYIYDNGLDYNKVYDGLYNNGVSIMEMRISNLHHETAIQSLLLVQEIEPDTWNKISDRIPGASSIKHIKKNSFQCPADLPNMFSSWEEYAIYLANNIIQDQSNRDKLFNKIKSDRHFYGQLGSLAYRPYWTTVINTILSSDWDFTKYQNKLLSKEFDTYRRFHKNHNNINKEKYCWSPSMIKSCKLLSPDEVKIIIDYYGKFKKAN